MNPFLVSTDKRLIWRLSSDWPRLTTRTLHTSPITFFRCKCDRDRVPYRRLLWSWSSEWCSTASLGLGNLGSAIISSALRRNNSLQRRLVSASAAVVFVAGRSHLASALWPIVEHGVLVAAVVIGGLVVRILLFRRVTSDGMITFVSHNPRRLGRPLLDVDKPRRIQWLVRLLQINATQSDCCRRWRHAMDIAWHRARTWWKTRNVKKKRWISSLRVTFQQYYCIFKWFYSLKLCWIKNNQLISSHWWKTCSWFRCCRHLPNKTTKVMEWYEITWGWVTVWNGFNFKCL